MECLRVTHDFWANPLLVIKTTSLLSPDIKEFREVKGGHIVSFVAVQILIVLGLAHASESPSPVIIILLYPKTWSLNQLPSYCNHHFCYLLEEFPKIRYKF